MILSRLDIVSAFLIFTKDWQPKVFDKICKTVVQFTVSRAITVMVMMGAMITVARMMVIMTLSMGIT